MSAETPDRNASDEDHENAVAAGPGGFLRASWAEGKRLMTGAALSAQIFALEQIALKRAAYRVGRKCYELGLHRNLFTDIFTKRDLLSSARQRVTVSAEPKPTLRRKIRDAGARLFSRAKAYILALERYPLLLRLGKGVATLATPELQEEQHCYENVQKRITALEARRAEVWAVNTGLARSAKTDWNRIGVSTRAAQARARALSDVAWTRARNAGAALSARWHKAVAGTRLERVTRRQALITVAAMAIAYIAIAACIEYWPIDENDPVAVARQADRLCAHPGDPARPEGVAGVADEKLLWSWRNGRALHFSMLAAEFDPENPRRLFELGRILLLAGEAEEARYFLDEAAALGHVGAQAYLGRLEPDPQKALAIFQKTAAAFPPAADMAAQMERYISSVYAEAGRKADELAAHPDDLTKPKGVRGVSDEALNSEEALEKAIAACADAVALFPEEPRYRFELGRALALAGLDDAKPHLEFAAKKEHAAALYYLATLEDNGLTALDHLRRANKGGFKAAEALKIKIEAEIGPDFEGEGYYCGDLLRSLYDSDPDHFLSELWENLLTSKVINDTFSEVAPELYSEQVSSALNRDKQAVLRELEGYRRMAKMGGMDMNDFPSANELSPQATNLIRKDVERFISTYGATGEAPKRISNRLKEVFY